MLPYFANSKPVRNTAACARYPAYTVQCLSLRIRLSSVFYWLNVSFSYETTFMLLLNMLHNTFNRTTTTQYDRCYNDFAVTTLIKSCFLCLDNDRIARPDPPDAQLMLINRSVPTAVWAGRGRYRCYSFTCPSLCPYVSFADWLATKHRWRQRPTKRHFCLRCYEESLLWNGVIYIHIMWKLFSEPPIFLCCKDN